MKEHSIWLRRLGEDLRNMSFRWALNDFCLSCEIGLIRSEDRVHGAFAHGEGKIGSLEKGKKRRTLIFN